MEAENALAMTRGGAAHLKSHVVLQVLYKIHHPLAKCKCGRKPGVIG